MAQSLLRQNITGTVTTEMITAGSRINNITEMLIAAVTTAVVDVYIGDSSNNFYIIKGVTVPIGASLVLDSKALNFDNSTSGYGLYIKLASGSVDVSISRQ